MKRYLIIPLILGALVPAIANGQTLIVDFPSDYESSCYTIPAHTGHVASFRTFNLDVSDAFSGLPYWYVGSTEDGHWYHRWWGPNMIGKVLWRPKPVGNYTTPSIANFWDVDVQVCEHRDPPRINRRISVGVWKR